MRTKRSGLPDADAIASASAELLTCLTGADGLPTLTPDLLSEAPASALYHLLPLVLSALQASGELCADDRDAFLDTLSAFRSRLCESPPLLARFLAHVAHPSYAAYWVVTAVEPADDADDESARACEVGSRGVRIDDNADAPAEDGGDEVGESDVEVSREATDSSDDQDDTLVPEDETFTRTRRAVTAPRAARAVRQVVLALPLDEALENTRKFWTEDVHGGGVDGGEVKKGFQFEVGENGGVRNPFLAPAVDADGGAPDDVADEEDDFESPADAVGTVVTVRKVFSSIARPFLVTVQASADAGTIGPSVLVKAGDDLTQDMAVSLVFQAVNCIWASDAGMRSTLPDDMAPLACWYDVAPTAVTRGIMRGVAGLSSLSEHNWRDWAAGAEGDRSAAAAMARTAAGGYVATYVVGGRDRHFDNIVIHDGRHLAHIDFTYIMGKKPPLDAPPIAIASEMEDAFKHVGVWDDFVDSCAAAYASARTHCAPLLAAAAMAFARTGVSVSDVSRFMRGKRSLNLGAADDEAVGAFVDQVKGSAHSAQTWVKRLAHQYVDPAWYSLIRSGFPPATAIIAYMDNVENKQAQKLADQLKSAADNVTDEDRVRIERGVDDA